MAHTNTMVDRLGDALREIPSVEHTIGVTGRSILASAKVRTEMSLQVLAYNMKRMIQIFGVGPLMAAIRA